MIDIGSTMYLELTEPKEVDAEGIQFRCRLIDQKESIYIIDYPINQQTNKLGFFLDGTQFSASFYGRDGVIYTFETEVIGRRKSNIPMLLLKNPGKEKYVRIQRRNHVRVEATVDVALHPIDGEFPPVVAFSHDISGGGCCVVIPDGKLLPNEGELNLWLILPMRSGDLVYVVMKCKILRVFRPHPEARERISLQFIEVVDRDRQKIVRYCFERQLILHRLKKE